MKQRNIYIAVLALIAAAPGCSTIRSIFGDDGSDEDAKKPIQNPFSDYYGKPAATGGQTMTLRTKNGSQSVELEVPTTNDDMSDVVVPISQTFADGTRRPASNGGPALDETYKDRRPSYADREITGNFPQSAATNNKSRQEIEGGLGLVPGDNGTPPQDTSYLVGIDHIKQLFGLGRYEVALIEVDTMLKEYPTDPRLYEMRGTLLDRVGQTGLAIRSWSQALRFDPNNASLKLFIEKKRKIAGVPSK